MLDNPRAVIGGNNPPTLTEEIAARHAALLASIKEVTDTELPLIVTSDTAAAQVSLVGKEATALVAKVNAAHTAEKKPHLDAGREVDTWKNATLGPLNAFLAECKALVGAWQDKREREEREAREAEARRLRAAAEAAEQAAMKSMTQPAMDRAVNIAEAAAVAEAAASAPTADLGRVTIGGKAVAARQAKWTYEVTNLEAIPRQYLMVSDAAIKAAIAVGVRDVPGLKIFQAKSTSFR